MDREIKIVKESKEEIELELNNLTIAELLRVHLNEDESVSFAAWKRDHPTQPIILLVKTKGKTAKKALNDAIASVFKKLEKIEADFKKLK